MENKEPIYLEERLIVIRPTNKNQIWNEQDWEISEIYNKEGNKIVLLRAKPDQ